MASRCRHALKTDKLEIPADTTAALAGFMINANQVGKARFGEVWQGESKIVESPFASASEARANFDRLIDEAAESHRPIPITGKRASAVLIATEDWRAIQDTLYLLWVPHMRASIKKAMAKPLSGNAKKLEW